MHLSMKHALKRDTLGHGNNSRLIEAMCTHQGNEVFSMRLLTSTTYIPADFHMAFITLVRATSLIEQKATFATSLRKEKFFFFIFN